MASWRARCVLVDVAVWRERTTEELDQLEDVDGVYVFAQMSGAAASWLGLNRRSRVRRSRWIPFVFRWRGVLSGEKRQAALDGL